MTEQVGTGGKAVGAIAAIFSVTGALAIFSVFAAVWNYSAEGAVLVTGGGAGLFGVLFGAQSRRLGRHWIGSLGLWLGLAVAIGAAIAVVAGEYTVEFG